MAYKKKNGSGQSVHTEERGSGQSADAVASGPNSFSTWHSSEMPPSRLSTVFDLSGLRLHTDGSLVLQSSKNTGLRFSKRTVRNARGSWIAKDAGGLASVPRYRKVAPREEGEIEGEIEEEEMDAPLPEGSTRNQDGKRESHFKTSRARKRRKFATDESYIAPDSTPENYTRLEKDSEPESLRPSAPPSSVKQASISVQLMTDLNYRIF